MRILLVAALFGSAPVLAQDFDDDFDEGFETSGENEAAKRVTKPVVREVVKGFYAKSNVGTAMYLLNFGGGVVKPGTVVGLALGQDFVDNERSSLAWEMHFTQGIHNGMDYVDQAVLVGDTPACVLNENCIQGDLRTYNLGVFLEAATYPNRRMGIGGRIGGGVLFAPLLMEPTLYEAEVLNGTWNIPDPGFHSYEDNRNPHPVAGAGVEIEYYSKLSHFSVGLNIDALYALGLDLGLNATGFLKYTF